MNCRYYSFGFELDFLVCGILHDKLDIRFDEDEIWGMVEFLFESRCFYPDAEIVQQLST